MRQWMFVVVAVLGITSTSGAGASNLFARPALGERPQLVAAQLKCGKMAFVDKSSIPRGARILGSPKAAPANSGAALISSR